MAFLPTNASQVQQFAVALYGIQVGSSTMTAVQADITAVGGLNNALNAYYAASFGSSTTASVAASVAANLGLTGTAATDAAAYITAVLNSTPANARGVAIQGVVSLFSTLTSNATFGAAATAWNTKVAAAISYTGAGDVAIVAGAATVGDVFTLTTGVDTKVGTAGNDTFVGNDADGVIALTALDSISGGAGEDTLSLTVVANLDLTTVTSATVNGVEKLNAITAGDLTANTSSGWGSGFTSVTGSAVGDAIATSGAAQTLTITAEGAIEVNGGSNVTITQNASATKDIAVGATTAAAGDVVVTQTLTVTADDTAGVIEVTGGKTITVTQHGISKVNTTATLGGVTIQGDKNTTSVTVVQDAALTEAAKVKGVANGAVDITDLDTADKSDSITTVTVNHFDDSTFTGNALTNLNLTGGTKADPSGDFTVAQSAGLTTDAPTTLALNTAGYIGTFTDTDAQYKTLNITASAATTLAGVDIAAVKTLTASGTGVTTITALTDVTALKTITSTGGGLALKEAIGTSVTFTGGDGADAVIVGATTKAIAMGAGNDTVTITADVGDGGSIDGGDGTDKLVINAAAADFSDAYSQTLISGFETLGLGADADGSYSAQGFKALTLGAVAADVAFTRVSSASTVTITAATTADVALTLTNSTGKSDSLSIVLSSDATLDQTAAGTVTLNGVETINVINTDTKTVAADGTASLNANTLTLTQEAGATKTTATSIVVTGNTGLTLTNTSLTKVTTFDASGITGDAANHAALAVVFTSANTTPAEAVSITGGAGDDELTGTDTANDTIVGGAGADTITTSGGLDVVTGGAGKDSIVLGATAATKDAYATITDLTVGDNIDFSEFTTADFTSTQLKDAKVTVGASATLTQALNLAAAGTADHITWFQLGGNTFVVADATAGATFAGTDSFIKITGLVDLSASSVTDGVLTVA